MTDPDLLASQPNDAYFKEVFSQPEYAAAFFRQHLPADVAAGIDWASLTLLPSSFVQQSLHQAHADLLFTASAGACELRLYLLFEHQTTPDMLMPLRLLGYVLAILQQHEQEHGLPLPPVLPFVLHQGPEAWTVSTRFEDLFALPPQYAEALLPYLPKFRHALLDLSRFDPAQDEHDAQIRVVLQLMKLAREKRLMEFFAWLAADFIGSLPESLLRTSLLYALHADMNLDVEQIAHTLELNHELREAAMSTAQKLIAQGKAEGEASGEARGRQEGRLEGEMVGLWLGKVQVLQELMGLPVTPREELADLAVAELESRFQELQRRYESQFKQR
ncbi:MAG: Rpn family recombination-promoting nuclease/putative transposase [Prosthecobacter sp.]|uniref:Rpn family recombination-promoting nuclease/putative transposase n=1 Tax=Prosthecobacter sp. TaxID=1965333 RepID=UPI0038FDEE38